MKTKTKILGGVAIAALVAVLAWSFAPRPLAVEVAMVDRGEFETTVDEDARTRLRDRYVVAAPLAGRLGRITLRAGDRVEAGAVLATLAPPPAPMFDARTRAELNARVGAAEAQWRRASAGVAGAEVALAQANAEARRNEELARQGFVSPLRAESERLAVQSAQMALDGAVQGREVARHDLAQARAALASTQAGAGAPPFEVKSPIAGQVLRVLQASETAVAIGTPLLEIGDTAQLEIVAEVLTSDALQLPAGASVRIERWGGPQDLAGRVRAVEPAAFTKVSALGVEEQRVNVLIDLLSKREDWPALGDGYRVGVRIVTRRVEDALRVPVSAVFPRPGGQGTAVFVVDGERARLTPVTIGARNGRHAWIQDGLVAGKSVIVYPPATLGDGMRVKPRQP